MSKLRVAGLYALATLFSMVCTHLAEIHMPDPDLLRILQLNVFLFALAMWLYLFDYLAQRRLGPF